MCVVEDFYQCLCVPARCCISTVLPLPWYYPSGHYHYVPSSGLTAPHIICSVKGTRLISMLTRHRGFLSSLPHLTPSSFFSLSVSSLLLFILYDS